MARAVQLSSKSSEHYGPPWLADLAHEVMGGIDLDPASCAAANRLIRARFYYSPERGEDGLREHWAGRVYLNPPGGQIKWQGQWVNQAALWWATLVARYNAGWVDEAIFTVFNLELFRYAQRWPGISHPLDFPYCMPKDRIDFHAPGEAPESSEPQGMPGHPNAVIYLWPKRNTWEAYQRFQKAFSPIGRTMPADIPF